MLRKLSSAVGFKGIFRKVLIFLLVGIANIIDVQVIGTGAVLRTAVIFFYISNEGVSLLENTAHLDLPIPEKLKDILSQLHGREEVKEDVKLTIKDLTVNPMKISHDAAQPVGYRIAYGDKKVGICTDLGVYNDYTVECLKGMDALLLEANHDVKMLQVGPYPYYLKQRILGDRGHLSNENSGKLLCRILHDKLQAIVLGHLSKENNLPELAYEAVRMEITMGENPYRAEDFRMMVADRSNVSPVINIA